MATTPVDPETTGRFKRFEPHPRRAGEQAGAAHANRSDAYETIAKNLLFAKVFAESPEPLPCHLGEVVQRWARIETERVE